MHATYTAASKVAKVTGTFWLIKILSTGMGETGADYLDHKYPPILVVAIAAVALALSLWWQFASRGYSATRYWTAVIMVSVFGTLAADAVHVALNIPYWASTLVFGLALVAIFALWHRIDSQLAMDQITTRRREFFYWCAVMATFALGTAAGDWLALGVGFGFFVGAVIFTAGYLIPLLLGRAKVLPATLAFWLAYTFTRPMGASVADWLALPPARGGLGYGTLNVTLIWLAAILVVLAATGWKMPPARMGLSQATGKAGK
jgi:uncharacterized membrane-anchored protein